MKKTSIFIVLVILLCSCERTELSSWNNSNTPVVFSIITPGRQVQVFIGKTGETKIENLLFYNDVKVTICDSLGNTAELVRKNNNSNIFVDRNNVMNLQKGFTYYLTVQINDIKVYAKTTIPLVMGKIIKASCKLPLTTHPANDETFSVYGTLTVTMQLSDPIQYGFFLSAFGQSLNRGILYSNEFFDQYLNLTSDTEAFPLFLVTTDPVYRNFLVSNYTDKYSTTGDIISIINSFGGVQPAYSNIKNGIGMFGSFVTDSLIVVLKEVNNN
jgi:hypothetical protein